MILVDAQATSQPTKSVLLRARPRYHVFSKLSSPAYSSMQLSLRLLGKTLCRKDRLIRTTVMWRSWNVKGPEINYLILASFSPQKSHSSSTSLLE